ncbi:hypothetical protein [Nocardia carnea]|uniref:hypothetical protein n=1 Tax=Nocardia carnea TaxID=37328 RepID=UPI0024572736|nr:hypothetical protein [Nocardia carnea]
MARATNKRPAELDRLIASDRIEVAATLLVAVFAGRVDEPYAYVGAYPLVTLLAEQYDIELKSKLAWNPRREPDGTVLRLAIDIQSAWRAAGLTGRGSSTESGEEVLLLRGATVLAGDDPQRAVCAALAESGASRSFR